MSKRIHILIGSQEKSQKLIIYLHIILEECLVHLRSYEYFKGEMTASIDHREFSTSPLYNDVEIMTESARYKVN